MKKAIEDSQGKNARFTENSDPTWWKSPHYLPSLPSQIPAVRKTRSASRAREEITGKITAMEAPALERRNMHLKNKPESAQQANNLADSGFESAGSPPTKEIAAPGKNRPSSAGTGSAIAHKTGLPAKASSAKPNLASEG